MIWRSAISFEELAQDGRGVKRATQMLSEFLWCLAARIRALCASRGLGLLVATLLCGQILAGTVAGSTRLIQSGDSAVRKRADFSGVVVWLTPTARAPIQVPQKHAKMVQKDKTFSPHILAIQTGTSVDFPNLDPIFHNAFSNYEGQIFDIALYPPGSSRTVRFYRPGIVRVFCNIHPSMSAIIVVVSSKDFATTDRDGHYSIPNVSPGTYQIHFFSERATPETLAKLKQDISVGVGEESLASVAISEAGYLPVAHKNKYGRDYPVDNAGSATYFPTIR
jgi:plastocyanin